MNKLCGEVGIRVYGYPVSLIHVVSGRDEGVLAAQRFSVQGLGFKDGLLAASNRGEKEEDLAAYLENFPIRTERVRQRSAGEFEGAGGSAGVEIQRREIHANQAR